MQILLMSLALLSWPVGVEPPLMITVPVAVTNTDFLDRPVEVCGHVTNLWPERNEAAMFGVDKWLIADTRGRTEFVVGRAACVTGVIRRRDGLTEQQRQEREIGRAFLSHGPPGDIVLYQCHDPASCERLMQPGPVRDDQLDTGASQAEPGQRG